MNSCALPVANAVHSPAQYTLCETLPNGHNSRLATNSFNSRHTDPVIILGV